MSLLFAGLSWRASLIKESPIFHNVVLGLSLALASTILILILCVYLGFHILDLATLVELKSKDNELKLSIGAFGSCLSQNGNLTCSSIKFLTNNLAYLPTYAQSIFTTTELIRVILFVAGHLMLICVFIILVITSSFPPKKLQIWSLVILFCLAGIAWLIAFLWFKTAERHFRIMSTTSTLGPQIVVRIGKGFGMMCAAFALGLVLCLIICCKYRGALTPVFDRISGYLIRKWQDLIWYRTPAPGPQTAPKIVTMDVSQVAGPSDTPSQIQASQAIGPSGGSPTIHAMTNNPIGGQPSQEVHWRQGISNFFPWLFNRKAVYYHHEESDPLNDMENYSAYREMGHSKEKAAKMAFNMLFSPSDESAENYSEYRKMGHSKEKAAEMAFPPSPRNSTGMLPFDSARSLPMEGRLPSEEAEYSPPSYPDNTEMLPSPPVSMAQSEMAPKIVTMDVSQVAGPSDTPSQIQASQAIGPSGGSPTIHAMTNNPIGGQPSPDTEYYPHDQSDLLNDMENPVPSPDSDPPSLTAAEESAKPNSPGPSYIADAIPQPPQAHPKTHQGTTIPYPLGAFSIAASQPETWATEFQVNPIPIQAEYDQNKHPTPQQFMASVIEEISERKERARLAREMWK